jgi:hypothetical protein
MRRPNQLLASVRVFGMSRRAAIEVGVQIQIPDSSRRWVKNLRVIGHWLRKCFTFGAGGVILVCRQRIGLTTASMYYRRHIWRQFGYNCVYSPWLALAGLFKNTIIQRRRPSAHFSAPNPFDRGQVKVEARLIIRRQEPTAYGLASPVTGHSSTTQIPLGIAQRRSL